MDEKRGIVALIVAVLALIFYFQVVAPLFTPQKEPPRPVAPRRAKDEPGTIAQRPPAPAPVETTPPAAVTSPPAGVGTELTRPAEQEAGEVVRNTDLFRVTLTNRGAAIKSVVLRDYKTFAQKDEELELVSDIDPKQLSLALAVTEMRIGRRRLRLAEVKGLMEGLDIEPLWEQVVQPKDPEAVQYVARVGQRLTITKTFRFHNPGDVDARGAKRPGRDIRLTIGFQNSGAEPVTLKYVLRTAAGIVPEPDLPPTLPLKQRKSRDVAAIVGSPSGEGVKITSYSPDEVESAMKRHTDSGGDPVYAGVKNRYFVAVVKPLDRQSGMTAALIERTGKHNVSAKLEVKSQEVPAGGEVTNQFMFFIAPRKPEVLGEYKGHHFEELVEYGWPAPVTRALAWLLRQFSSVTPNYGFAIVMLTICVRLILHPLTLKSQKSAHRMQQIQPLISEIKEKYKHDKRVQQQETMRVMREQQVSPLGGCLPMLLQLPIFIGLWRALYQDAALRHEPFMLWINDLSKPDNLFAFGSPLPLVGWRSFNLLPLLCAVLMFVQHKMSPKPNTEQARQQQKMFMLMPIVFTFVLYHMPSGLMVYFLCSSLFGILEQRFIRTRLDAAAAVAAAEEKPVVPVEQKRQKPAPRRRKRRRK